MKYTSIHDIKNDFGLETDDISEIKTTLRGLLKDIHPDTANGGKQFKNKLDEINYEKLISALDYINQDFAIVPKSELTALATILKDNIPAKKEETQTKNLEEKIDKIIKVYHDSNLTPKISSTVIAALLSFLWLFPSTVKDHLILSRYLSPENPIFTGVWFYSLIMTAAYWALLKHREERLKYATKKLNLESVQNKLFESFISSKKYTAEKEGGNFFFFSKDNLIEHLTELDIFELKYNPRILHRANPAALILLPFISARNKNIELELAQTLADIIIERAKRKNVLQLEQDNNLSDTYKYQLTGKKAKSDDLPF